jgi:hypothetical protein
MKDPRRFASTRLRFVAFKVRRKTLHAVERFITLSCYLPDHAAFVRTLYDSYVNYVPAVAFWCSSRKRRHSCVFGKWRRLGGKSHRRPKSSR